jgi:uncharacterized protein DUF6600
MTIRGIASVLAVAMALVVPHAASAEPESAPGGATPLRLSFTDGDVSLWRPGADDWAPAKINTPLAAGDSLYAAEGSNAEVELGGRQFVRAGADTELGVETLQPDFVQLKVTAGHAGIDVRGDPRRTIEVDTPNAAFTIDHAGYYRVDVDKERTAFVTRDGGRASILPAGGQSTDVAPDTQVVLEGTDNPETKTGGAPQLDAWDRWNGDRTAGRSTTQTARYVPPGVAGGDDLDRYGAWHNDPQYGAVWAPAAAPAGWAPYTTGRWIWDPYYGWTWVDDAPWGWAPFHYGRWVFTGGGWFWAPGPAVITPVYAPALVAFFAPPIGVSVSVGFPFVSWVALGFGEPCVPWWGPVGFVGHAWWGGWGGPHVVNNVVIQHNTYVNVRNITTYRNEHVRNAVVGVDRQRFGRPGVEHVRLTRNQLAALRPLHGNLGVRPVPESVQPAAGHAVRPPDAIRARQVVATRPPQDPRPHLHAAGLAPAPSAAPPPRIVQAPGSSPHARGGSPTASATQALPPPPHTGTASGRGATPASPGAHTGSRGPADVTSRGTPAPVPPPHHTPAGSAPHRAPATEAGTPHTVPPPHHGSGGAVAPPPVHQPGVPHEGRPVAPAPERSRPAPTMTSIPHRVPVWNARPVRRDFAANAASHRHAHL